MAGLDEVSKAIGRLEGDVQGLARTLDGVPAQLEAMEQRLAASIAETRASQQRQVSELSASIERELGDYRRRDDARRDALHELRRDVERGLVAAASLRGRLVETEQRVDNLESAERERRTQRRVRRRDLAVAGSVGGGLIAVLAEGVKLWWGQR